MPRKIVTAEQETAICEMYEQVETARIVASEFGVSSETIYRILKKHGIPRTHRHEKPKNLAMLSNCSTKRCPGVVHVLRAVGNYSNAEIGEFTGYGTNCVCQIMRRRYPELYQSRCIASNFDIDAIEREYIAGASTYELGERYGVAHETISKWMRKRGHHRGKGRAHGHREICPRCGREFVTFKPNMKFCSRTCANAVRGQHRIDIVRANTDGPVERITLREIWERDKGRCYLCGRMTDWDDYYIKNGGQVSGPRYPTRDHVVALHNGGTHTRDNIRLACFECNSKKRDLGQMRLPMAI